MKTKRVTRYYCDYCHRGKFSGPAMKEHELICYHRQDRQCRECNTTQDVPAAIAVLRDVITKTRSNAGGIAALEEHVHGCPACMMATVIQANKTRKEEYEFVMYDTYSEDLREWRNLPVE